MVVWYDFYCNHEIEFMAIIIISNDMNRFGVEKSNMSRNTVCFKCARVRVKRVNCECAMAFWQFAYKFAFTPSILLITVNCSNITKKKITHSYIYTLLHTDTHTRRT